MALPALAPVAATAGRALASAAPAVASKAMDYIRRATGGRVTNLAQAATYAANSKAGFSVVSEGLVKAGVPPSHVFTDDVLRGMHDADILALYTKLQGEFGNVYGAIDASSPFKPDSGATRDIIALETINYIGRKFGVQDARGLKELHAKLKLFGAMDEAQLEQALAIRSAAAGGVGRFA